MHAQRHGGALVIVPPADPGGGIRDIAFTFCFESEAMDCIRNAVEELTLANNNLGEPGQITVGAELHSLYVLSAEAHRKMLDVVCKSVGRLSRVDGAVVMDTDLRVYGFGAKLSGASGDFTVLSIDAITGSVEEVTVVSLGGMRHQSAARYVKNSTDSMVIVASQDGRLTLFAWMTDEGKVTAIRGLEHYTWSGADTA
jgi:hypothetical protein